MEILRPRQLSDIVASCGGELDITTPCSGTAVKYGYPVMAVVAQTSATITVSGNTPTYAELLAALGNSGEDKAIIIPSITNGQRVEVSREEQSGADTSDGGTDVFGYVYAITGRIKLLNENFRDQYEATRVHTRMKLWYITNKGWCFGGTSGYRVSWNIGQLIKPGFGDQPYYDVNWQYQVDMSKTDEAEQDQDFLTLNNTFSS